MLLLVGLLLIHVAFGYIAQFEIEIERFRTINNELIATDFGITSGSCCDYPRAGGMWNPCDFVFYIEQCTRDEFFVEYRCFTILQRFYAPEDTEDVIYNSSVPRPYTTITLNGNFPATLVVNVTVYDQDDGFSNDDYVGTYTIYLTRQMLNNGGREFATFIDHYVTIPQHSELLIRYRGYCLDFECRNANTAPAFLSLTPGQTQNNQDQNQFVRRSLQLRP